MNTTTRFILWLILVILLGLLWFGPWYPCWQEVFCPDCIKGAEVSGLTEGETTEPETTAVIRGPLDFKWSDVTPYQNEGFAAYKAQVLAGKTDDNILEITGLYYDGEPAPEGFENMGLARAAQIRKLFPDVPDDRILLKARAEDETDGTRTGYFTASAFNWLEADKTAKESVEELADRTVIRFPLNSAQKISDPGIDEYLDKLAKRVISTGEQIQLTGHTDNTGGEDTNMVLGQNRADAIQRILLSKGVPQAQISAKSRGEEQPVASNDTESGKAENRRVEVRFLKSN
ncbi:MAG: OmpA family protein [Saprospiraceae bacterium]|nr:OmpA family protein [Saprospiraceae bacterium]